jgi:hypothetical protein
VRNYPEPGSDKEWFQVRNYPEPGSDKEWFQVRNYPEPGSDTSKEWFQVRNYPTRHLKCSKWNLAHQVSNKEKSNHFKFPPKITVKPDVANWKGRFETRKNQINLPGRGRLPGDAREAL